MKTLLRFIKYLFILTTLAMVFVVGIFVYYARKLDYMIPKTVNVEVYDARGTQFLTLYGDKKRSYIKLEEIDRKIIDAFISIEDKKFYQHRGIDILRIGGALLPTSRPTPSAKAPRRSPSSTPVTLSRLLQGL